MIQRFARVSLALMVAIMWPGAAYAEQGKEKHFAPPANVNGQDAKETARFEPNIPQVQFYEMDAPKTLEQKIDALLYGITIDIPPEYDHYGYDIRRYMASAGNMEALNDPKYVREEIRKIEHAQKILMAWRKKVILEAEALEKEIASDADTKRKSMPEFRYNKAKADAFFVEAHSWIENNLELLKVLDAAEGNYTVDEEGYNFEDEQTLHSFTKFYDARQKSLKEMHKYVPFRVMVY